MARFASASPALVEVSGTHACAWGRDHAMRVAAGQILVWKELNYGHMREKEKQLVVSEVSAHTRGA